MAVTGLPTNPNKRRSDLVYAMNGSDPAFNPTQNPAQASLPANYNFNDLANYETAARNAYGQNASADILNTRDQLSQSLSDYGQNFFEQQNPALLEDLNKRGLLTSPTAVSQAQAQALKEIALSNENYLSEFDTSALSARLQAQQDALDAGSNLRSTGLEAGLNETQAQREEAMARDLAKKSGRNQLNGALIGAGGSVLGGSLPDIIKGIFAKKAAAAVVPKLASTIAPGTLADAGVADVVGTPAAAGGGLGTAAGVGAIGTAGVGSALLSRSAQNKVAAATGSNAAGSAAGVLASPIGAQLNVAKSLVTNPSKAFNNAASSLGIGAGKTANGKDISAASYDLQDQLMTARKAKAAVDSGQMTPEEYTQFMQPLIANAGEKIADYTKRGQVWANSIMPTLNAFQKEGFIKSQNGNWVLGNDPNVVLWRPGEKWNYGATA